ncbi:MAG: hypothetical protein JO011_08820, partial [Ktedonobacteraceae bacterium]|nr:hypothetical protein [Ktedonobacteraceae bacterium]
VVFRLNGRAVGDAWDQIIVIYNANNADITVNLPDGVWNVVVKQGLAGEQVLSQVIGSVVVEAIACVMLHRDR